MCAAGQHDVIPFSTQSLTTTPFFLLSLRNHLQTPYFYQVANKLAAYYYNIKKQEITRDVTTTMKKCLGVRLSQTIVTKDTVNGENKDISGFKRPLADLELKCTYRVLLRIYVTLLYLLAQRRLIHASLHNTQRSLINSSTPLALPLLGSSASLVHFPGPRSASVRMQGRRGARGARLAVRAPSLDHPLTGSLAGQTTESCKAETHWHVTFHIVLTSSTHIHTSISTHEYTSFHRTTLFHAFSAQSRASPAQSQRTN